jgi:hypothetical protein
VHNEKVSSFVAKQAVLAKRSPGFPVWIAFAFWVPSTRAWGSHPFNIHLDSQLPE